MIHNWKATARIMGACGVPEVQSKCTCKKMTYSPPLPPPPFPSTPSPLPLDVLIKCVKRIPWFKTGLGTHYSY